jgi:hypothetical protein
MQAYLTFSMQHVQIVIHMDKRALLRQGVFFQGPHARTLMALRRSLRERIDDLINLMLHLRDDVKPAGSATRILALSSTLML